MNQILFTVISFFEKYTILENSLYGQIQWPIKELPAEIEIGSQVTIGVIAKSQEQQIQTQQFDAKKLLEELLN